MCFGQNNLTIGTLFGYMQIHAILQYIAVLYLYDKLSYLFLQNQINSIQM